MDFKKYFMKYVSKLKDPRWQKKRLDILNRDKFKCQVCYNGENTLHVHHRIYIRGKEPWEVADEYLVTLCEVCHRYETEEMPDAIVELNEAVKGKFFAYEIQEIAEGFKDVEIIYNTQVIAAVIKYWLCDGDRMKELVDKYFDSMPSNENLPF